MAKVPPDAVVETKRIHNCDQRAPVIELAHISLPRPLRLEQRGATSEGFMPGTSSVAWPVALRFAKHLCDRPALVRGLEVVELGAGIGLVGASAAAVGARRTVITDCDEAMPLLERNRVRLAEDGVNVEVARVNWGDAEDHRGAHSGPGFDVVLASDVVVPGFDTDKLLASCVALLKRTPEARVFLSYEFRDEWQSIGNFLQWAGEAGLEVSHQTLGEDGNEDSDEECEHFLYTFWWRSNGSDTLVASVEG